MYNTITSTIAALAAIIALYLVWRQPKPSTTIRETPGATYYYDTSTIIHRHTRTQIEKTITDTIHVNIPAQIDTAAILKQYFTLTYHSDTIRDTNLVAVISDTIGYNRLLSRTFKYQITRPTTIVKKRPRFAAGIIFDKSLTPTPTITCDLNRKWAVSAGYSLTRKSPEIGLFCIIGNQ